MKTSSSAVISGSGAPRAACGQVAGEQESSAGGAFESGTPEKDMRPSPVARDAVVAPAPVPLTLRKSMLEMSADLQQLLEQPFPGTSLFYVLDKIGRLSKFFGSDGVTLDHLVENCAIAPDKSAPRLAVRLQKATEAGHLQARGIDGAVRYQLSQEGRRYVGEATQARLKLWKVNPRMPLGQVCAITDLEEFRDEISQANVIQARKRTQAQAATGVTAPRRKQKPTVRSPWAGLLHTGVGPAGASA